MSRVARHVGYSSPGFAPHVWLGFLATWAREHPEEALELVKRTAPEWRTIAHTLEELEAFEPAQRFEEEYR